MGVVAHTTLFRSRCEQQSPAPTGAVEVFDTPQTLTPLTIEIFAFRDLEDSSTGTADNNNSNNEEDNNNDN